MSTEHHHQIIAKRNNTQREAWFLGQGSTVGLLASRRTTSNLNDGCLLHYNVEKNSSFR
jgi:hypothetical protein